MAEVFLTGRFPETRLPVLNQNNDITKQKARWEHFSTGLLRNDWRRAGAGLL